MRKTLILLLLFFTSALVTNAQMNTDNSYLRKNYLESKTAKKAAEKRAQKKALKEARLAKKQAKNGQKSSTTKPSAKATTLNTKYLAGAVPTTNDGIVCFSHTFVDKNKNAQQFYDVFKNYALNKINGSQNLDISRILSESPDTLIATICEPLYFKRKKWESDSTLIQYQYNVTFKDNTATLRIWFISYAYDQEREFSFNYRAEEWISDQYALSKDGLSLLRLPGKFRRKTVDYVNGIFEELEKQLQP